MGKPTFLNVSSFYSQVLSELYSKNPDLASQSYDKQYRATMDTLFGWADFWKLNLDKLEKFETIEIVANNEFLQKAWAKENNIYFSKDNWLLEILEAQIKYYQPEILFLQDRTIFTNSFLSKVKKLNPCIKLLIGWDGLLHNNIDFYKEYDLILVPLRDTAEYYQKNGKLTYLFLFGFETSILEKIRKDTQPKYDVSFVGSIIYQKEYHTERFNTLGYISGKIDLNLWASGFPTRADRKMWQPFRYAQRQRLRQRKWKEWLYLWRLGAINQGALFGREMYQTLSDSKITLNTHVDVAGKFAGNMRLYEATGLGTCLLTDWKENLHEFFKLEEELVTYKTSQEAVDKIRYLLKNESERQKIAQAGQKRVMRDYSFEKRVRDFVSFLEKNM